MFENRLDRLYGVAMTGMNGMSSAKKNRHKYRMKYSDIKMRRGKSRALLDLGMDIVAILRTPRIRRD
jgi:hypothetical protein